MAEGRPRSPVEGLVVGALGAEAEVVVGPVDDKALLDQHVHDVEVVGLGRQHDGRDVWREAGTAVLLVVEPVLELQLHARALVRVHGVAEDHVADLDVLCLDGVQERLLDRVQGALLQQVGQALVVLTYHPQLKRRPAQVVAAVDVEGAVVLNALLQRRQVARLRRGQEATLRVGQRDVPEDPPGHLLGVRVLPPAVLALLQEAVVVLEVLGVGWRVQGDGVVREGLLGV